MSETNYGRGFPYESFETEIQKTPKELRAEFMAENQRVFGIYGDHGKTWKDGQQVDSIEAIIPQWKALHDIRWRLKDFANSITDTSPQMAEILHTTATDVQRNLAIQTMRRTNDAAESYSQIHYNTEKSHDKNDEEAMTKAIENASYAYANWLYQRIAETATKASEVVYEQKLDPKNLYDQQNERARVILHNPQLTSYQKAIQLHQIALGMEKIPIPNFPSPYIRPMET